MQTRISNMYELNTDSEVYRDLNECAEYVELYYYEEL